MADDTQPKNGDDRIGASRGPAYPYINLERAVEKATIIADKGAARQKMPPETFYKLWGMGAKSSGSRQTMAALNYYDLVEYVGRGTDRKVQLTELALRIVLDKQPNSSARKEAIQKAALEPQIFRELYDRYAPLLPDDVVIETYLKIERAFNDEGARATIKHFRDTMEYAGLDQPTNKPDERDSNSADGGVVYGGARVGDLVDYEAGGSIRNSDPLKVRAVSADQAWVFVEDSETGLEMEQVIVKERPAAPFPPEVPIDQAFGRTPPPTLPLSQFEGATGDKASTPKGYRSETFDADEGTIKISWPDNLSAQSVDDMKDWLELLKRRIERRAAKGGTAE